VLDGISITFRECGEEMWGNVAHCSVRGRGRGLDAAVAKCVCGFVCLFAYNSVTGRAIASKFSGQLRGAPGLF